VAVILWLSLSRAWGDKRTEHDGCGQQSNARSYGFAQHSIFGDLYSVVGRSRTHGSQVYVYMCIVCVLWIELISLVPSSGLRRSGWVARSRSTDTLLCIRFSRKLGDQLSSVAIVARIVLRFMWWADLVFQNCIYITCGAIDHSVLLACLLFSAATWTLDIILNTRWCVHRTWTSLSSLARVLYAAWVPCLHSCGMECAKCLHLISLHAPVILVTPRCVANFGWWYRTR